MVYNRLYSFLSQSNFFYDLQFGFRKNHSTGHAAAVMVKNIIKSFEDKEYTLGVFLDLSKAFDTIDHSILLAKLNRFGVRGEANKWFRSYLNGRLMHMEIDGKISNSKPNVVGVPQGSILDPLLFLIYINDFPKCLTSGKAIFADDTNLFFNSSSYQPFIHSFIHAYELMLGLHVFRQTGPPRWVDCLAPPSVCYIKTEASR